MLKLSRSIAWLLCFVLVLTAVLPMLPQAHAFSISSGELATPSTYSSTPGTHYYTLKSLPLGTAVQDFAINGDYIYVTQRVSSTSGDIYISRCKIDRSTGVPYNATHDSHMIITNAGYGESLDIFTYNGTTYLLTGLYAQNNNTDDKWSLQIGRVAYAAGKTYAHSDIRRFKSLEYSGLRADESQYANTLAKLNGDIDRVNACVGDTYTVFRVQMSVLRSGEYKCGIFYAYFYTSTLFSLLDSGSYDFDNGSSSATAHQNAHYDTFYQCEENANLVLPNYGFQGMEATNGKNIYVAAGNDGEAPIIGRMSGSTYANQCTITNIGKVEIQGLHYQDHHMYFASTTGGDAYNRNWQKIYQASTCIAGYGSHSSAAKTGYAATCTTAGRTDGTYCTRCGDILSGYEVINPLNHSFDSGTVTQAASGMTDGTMTIACTRGDHSFTVPIPSANIPLSYAKPLQANLLNEVAYSNGSDTTVTGVQLASLDFADTTDESLATAELYDSSGGSTPNCLLLKPTAMLSQIIRINSNISATVGHTTSGVSYSISVTMPVPIQIVPATSVYYETDFSSNVFTQQMKQTSNTWSTSGETQSDNQSFDASSSVPTYGYDATYADDPGLSNGSALSVEGEGVPMIALDADGNRYINLEGAEKYTGISFTFTGTGFDIISRTGPNQGGLRILVCDAAGAVIEVISVLNKGNNDLYQIPVVSAELDAYGTYTVYIFVNAAYDYDDDEDPTNGDSFNGALDRGGEFYFDAVRIYNPINTDATDADSAYAYALYQAHGEANPTFKELRNILIDASKDVTDATMEGVVYLDTENESATSKIAEYTALGPNNEVYLAAGNAIAFKLEVEGTIPASIDIGAKSADGNAVTMTISVGTSVSSTASSTDQNIATATALYYPLEIDSSLWQSSDDKSYIYLTVANGGESGVLSVTDIKYAYGPATTTMAMSRSVRFVIDREVIGQYANCEHVWDEGTVVCEATCTQTGVKVYACSACGGTRTEEITQLEHSYTDGACVCGAVEVIEPETKYNERLKFTMSISVGAEMTVSYNIMGADVNSYTDFYLEVKKDVAGGEHVTTIYGITDDREAMTAKTDPTTGEAVMYQVTYKGINAKEMGDNFSTTLYAVAEDGTVYYGPTTVSSIKDYLVTKIDDSTSIAELKTMAVDMLKYGAAAQIRLGYNTENLVTADLTEEQLAYATQEIPEAVDNATVTGEGADVNTNITVTSRVQLNLSCIYTEANDPNAVKCVVTDSESNVLAEIAITNKGGIMFTAIYENVGAKQMRDVINATFYEGETAISKTISWSVESYVAQTRAKENAAANELNMVNTMLTYGDAVAAYLEKLAQ